MKSEVSDRVKVQLVELCSDVASAFQRRIAEHRWGLDDDYKLCFLGSRVKISIARPPRDRRATDYKPALSCDIFVSQLSGFRHF